MASVRRQRPQLATEVEEKPRLDPAVAYLWRIWVELHQGRQSGFGLCPISWQDLDAYSRLTDERLLPWEARAIRAVDETFVATMNSDTATGASQQ